MDTPRNRPGFGATPLLGTLIGAVLFAHAPALVRAGDDEPPVNLVVASERIHTSGQPSEAQLGGLRAAGYDMVINLAPPEVPGSLMNEGGLVGQTGLVYLGMPIDWHQPSIDDFTLFGEVLQRSGSRRVLVHCQTNKRASLFTFLYRVAYQGADPDDAYEKVTEIWAPDPHWQDFAQRVLAAHGIDLPL